MKYVALLRGINVGGNHKVPMAELKKIYEDSDCRNVSTYINTGNVIFEDDRSFSELYDLLSDAMLKQFGFTVPLLLKTATEFITIADRIPEIWSNDNVQKSDVLFLWQGIDREDILQSIDIDHDIDRASYVPVAILWNVDREYASRSKSVKLVGTELYKQMTIRNVNTVRKIAKLLYAD